MSKTVPLLYIGRRYINDVLADSFLENGNEKKQANFRSSSRRYCYIGKWYYGQSKGGDDLSLSKRTPDEAPKMKEPPVDKIEKWEIADGQAVIAADKKKEGAKAKRRLDEFKSGSYSRLREACHRMSYFEAHDFISYLVNSIQKDNKK